MSSDLKSFISQKNQKANEKEIFGKEIYIYSNILPPLSINERDRIEYKDFFEKVGMIASQFGADITHLFAELCLIHDIKEIDDIKYPSQMIIRYIAQDSLGKIGLCLNQLESIVQSIVDENEVEIKGEDYCFVLIFLHDLFEMYSSIINQIYILKYLNKDFIESIRERIYFIISEEYEQLRKFIKVVEKYELIKKTAGLYNSHFVH